MRVRFGLKHYRKKGISGMPCGDDTDGAWTRLSATRHSTSPTTSVRRRPLGLRRATMRPTRIAARMGHDGALEPLLS